MCGAPETLAVKGLMMMMMNVSATDFGLEKASDTYGLWVEKYLSYRLWAGECLSYADLGLGNDF